MNFFILSVVSFIFRSFIDWLIRWIDRLIDWLICFDWLIDRLGLIDWLIDWFDSFDWLIDLFIFRILSINNDLFLWFLASARSWNQGEEQLYDHARFGASARHHHAGRSSGNVVGDRGHGAGERLRTVHWTVESQGHQKGRQEYDRHVVQPQFHRPKRRQVRRWFLSLQKHHKRCQKKIRKIFWIFLKIFE